MTRGCWQLALVPALVLCGCTAAPGDVELASNPAVTSALESLSPSSFTLFETGQVRPLALAHGRLYVANTPDNRLEIFDVGRHGLSWRGAVTVGLEPIAVAARSKREVWVVNHLSDSISIVDVQDPDEAYVARTLLVGDEPRDIVFAGRHRDRAFITTAHRGQNIGFDPQLQAPGVPRADVWVFDADQCGGAIGGTPLTILHLFTDTPRALAVSRDRGTVYAAGFHTGNRTTALNELLVPDGGQANGGLPWPNTNAAGQPQPETGLIVRHDGTNWVDTIGRTWNDQVRFNLPDKDVFAIDANANPPVQRSYYTGVGTVLYNMAVNPVSGRIYVSNTEALNHVRFAGPGTFAGSTVRGHMHESRITVLAGASVMPRHLNKHIDYSTCCAPLPNAENAKSLAIPMEMVVSDDGKTLYVAAFGSSKVGVFSTAALEANTFVPDTAKQIAVSGGGPSGLVLDDDEDRLYVLTRFDNSLSIIDTKRKREIAHLPLYNPEPESVVRGRPFLYDAARTSSHGDSACASCHVFGDFDSLAWDLGDPDADSIPSDNPTFPEFNPFFPAEQQEAPAFAAMKGPMTTQSLRGLANHGPMHWRGDRTGAGPGSTSAQPDDGAFDEHAAFMAFNAAFDALNGRNAEIAPADMEAFTAFALQISYPPNPVRNLDDSLTPDQAEGAAHFVLARTDDRCPPGVDCNTHPELQFSCERCHTENDAGNAEFGVPFPGFFGTSGVSFRITFDPVRSQPIKNPHLRNLYTKVGMFGMPQLFVMTPFGLLPGTQGTGFMGDQIRGFGYIHDGSFDTVEMFLSNASFANFVTPNGFPFGPPGHEQRAKLADYLLAFDSNLKPIVGQQITLTRDNAAVTGARVDLLIARAEIGDCELVAKAVWHKRETGYVYDPVNRVFVADRDDMAPVTNAQLRWTAAKKRRAVTYTCAPKGSGYRMGIDADLDGDLDGDEIAAGTDPRDPDDHS
jgi:DNA-binding beta-propeller fold protein YncE